MEWRIEQVCQEVIIMTIIENINKELISAGEYMAMLYQMSGRPADFHFSVKDGENVQNYVLMIRAVPQDFEQPPADDVPADDSE